MKPLHDYVALEPILQKDKTKSGIILPDTEDKETPERGKVAFLGPGILNQDGTRSKMFLKKGDEVIFKKYSPDAFTLEGKDYLLMRESEIIAIV